MRLEETVPSEDISDTSDDAADNIDTPDLSATPGTTAPRNLSGRIRADYSCYTTRHGGPEGENDIVAVIIEAKMTTSRTIQNAVAQVKCYQFSCVTYL